MGYDRLPTKNPWPPKRPNCRCGHAFDAHNQALVCCEGGGCLCRGYDGSSDPSDEAFASVARNREAARREEERELKAVDLIDAIKERLRAMEQTPSQSELARAMLYFIAERERKGR